eukprot:scpid87158/ scgid16219/ 
MASWSTVRPMRFLVALTFLVDAFVPLTTSANPPSFGLQGQTHLQLPFTMTVVEGTPPGDECDCIERFKQDVSELDNHTGNTAATEYDTSLNVQTSSEGCEWMMVCKYSPSRFPHFYQVATAVRNTEGKHCKDETGSCNKLMVPEMVLRRRLPNSATRDDSQGHRGVPGSTGMSHDGWSISMERRAVGFVCEPK